MSQEDINVWFRLVDKTGHILDGTTEDFVSIPPTSSVADFRHAVKRALPNRLALYDALVLKVYQNHALLSTGAMLHLQHPIRNNGVSMGSSPDNALLVVVPIATRGRLYEIGKKIRGILNLQEETLWMESRSFSPPYATFGHTGGRDHSNRTLKQSHSWLCCRPFSKRFAHTSTKQLGSSKYCQDTAQRTMKEYQAMDTSFPC